MAGPTSALHPPTHHHRPAQWRSNGFRDRPCLLDDRHVLADALDALPECKVSVVSVRFVGGRGTCEADSRKGHLMSTDAPASAPDPLPRQGAEDAEDARLSGPAETVSGPGADEAVSGEDVPSAAAAQPFALVAPPPPPRRRRRPPKWLLPVVGGVLAAALVAGLLVWQPWSPRPIAPVSLTAESPTGTSVQLSRPAPHGGG